MPTSVNTGSDLKSTGASYAQAAINVVQGKKKKGEKMGVDGEGRDGLVPPITDVAGNVAVVPVDAQQQSVLSFARDGFADISDGGNGLSGTNLHYTSMKVQEENCGV